MTEDPPRLSPPTIALSPPPSSFDPLRTETGRQRHNVTVACRYRT
jgi:hypothetical protein